MNVLVSAVTVHSCFPTQAAATTALAFAAAHDALTLHVPQPPNGRPYDANIMLCTVEPALVHVRVSALGKDTAPQKVCGGDGGAPPPVSAALLGAPWDTLVDARPSPCVNVSSNSLRPQ